MFLANVVNFALIYFCETQPLNQTPLISAEVIKDIGNGLNFKRKGLRTILDRLLRGDQLTIVVTCRDRLTRFGFELIQYLVEQHGGKSWFKGKLYTVQSQKWSPMFSLSSTFFGSSPRT